MRTKLFFCTVVCLLLSLTTLGQRQMEALNRGLVAVKVSGGVYLSWRLLPTDGYHVKFNVYRNGTLITTISETAATCYTDAAGQASSQYLVKPVVRNKEVDEGSTPVTPWSGDGLVVQLQRPAGGTTPPNVEHDGTASGTAVSYPNGQSYTYTPNDCSTADLDGDGEYEIIVKWDPSNSKDNSQTGITGNVYLDAYKLSGARLWRIDLGRNIRAGAHYTQFMVYDFDGCGKAEMVVKTAPGTVDGLGKNVIMGTDDPQADYRNLNLSTSGNSRTGFIINGPEYLTLFNGETGGELHTIAYKPGRGNVSGWGGSRTDGHGNRVDRFLACVAYLDGVNASAVMCRGYYGRATLVAYDVKNKQLVERWFYDSGTSASSTSCFAQGNHNLSVADVDSDGKDEILYGSCALNDDGTFMYSTGLGHGDAMHVGKMLPDRPGLQVWQVHEETSAKYSAELHDARTGEIIWGQSSGTDNGRGMAADIDSRYRGYEMWSSLSGTFDKDGAQISSRKPSNNFRVYWDGDLQDELLDGQTSPSVRKWSSSGTDARENGLKTFDGMSTCNTTKATPSLSADILGDWREEVVLYNASDPSKLVVFTTTTPTTTRFYTLMSDPVYRLAIAWQNVAYNQPPHLGFYLPDSVAALEAMDIPDNDFSIRIDPAGGVFENGSSTAIALTATKDTVLGSLPNVTRVGYTFAGWYVGGEPYSPELVLSSAATISARWNVIMYTVSFSGEAITTWDTLVQHNTRVAKPDIARQDYEVLGWMKDGVLWNFSNPVTEDMELVVRWMYTGTGEPPITSVAENAWAQLMVYPNPTSDIATLSGLEGGETVSIVDMRGTLHRQMRAEGERVVIDRLPPGVYVVVVAKEGYAKTLKLVVR